MSLVFTAVTPHTPLLLPSIGKENLELLSMTRAAMQRLEQDLYVAQPETIIVVTPHGQGLPDAMVINTNPEYVTNFEEFGDLVTKFKWRSDFMIIDRIREDFKAKHLPLVLDTAENLDYASAIPLYYLTQHLPQVKIIPLVSSQLDLKAHFEFGRELKDEIMSATRRIAIVGSADLSHRVGPNAPAGFSERGVAFDEKIKEIIAGDKPGRILEIDDAWLNEAQACGARVMAMLAGVLDDVNHKTEILSYEKPFGVGYLVAHMQIA